MLNSLASIALLLISIHVLQLALSMRRRSIPRTFRPPAEDGMKSLGPVGGGAFMPSPIDIAVVRAMLIRARSLPPDLVDNIFDFAEYWAHSTVELAESTRISGGLTMPENILLLRSYPIGLINLGGDESVMPSNARAYGTSIARPIQFGDDKAQDARTFAKLAKYPTPRLISPARKVVFSIRSQDQGWATESETTSWTWFEAGLERYDADHVCQDTCDATAREHDPEAHTGPLRFCALRPLQPKPSIDPESGAEHYAHPLFADPAWTVVHNKLKERQWRVHSITWSYLDNDHPESEGARELEAQGRGRETGDGTFVRNLRLGDVITLWGKVRFPGWANRIEEARIDVYWAV